jgi:hypothetical protein
MGEREINRQEKKKKEIRIETKSGVKCGGCHCNIMESVGPI